MLQLLTALKYYCIFKENGITQQKSFIKSPPRTLRSDQCDLERRATALSNRTNTIHSKHTSDLYTFYTRSRRWKVYIYCIKKNYSFMSRIKKILLYRDNTVPSLPPTNYSNVRPSFSKRPSHTLCAATQWRDKATFKLTPLISITRCSTSCLY